MDREDPKESEKEDRRGKKPMRDSTKMAAVAVVVERLERLLLPRLQRMNKRAAIHRG